MTKFKLWNQGISAGLGALCLAFAFSTPIEAQIINWANPSGGWWDVGTNWTGGLAPNASQTARFGLSNTYSVDWDGFTGNTTTAGLQVNSGNVTFRSASGGPWTHTVAGSEARVDGSLNLGTSASNRFNLMTQNGLGCFNGRVFVNFGSQINASSSTITLTGNVGSLVEVTGGSVVNSLTGIFGNSLGSGRVIVSGVGSQWNSGGDLIWGGAGGFGQLNVMDGGQVSSFNGFVGQANGLGNVTVNGAGSRWNSSNSLIVGEAGAGLLFVTAGGLVSSNDVTIAKDSSSLDSTVTINGVGSHLSTTNLTVGRSGRGILNIEAGGLVNSTSSIIGLSGPGTVNSIATITGTGSRWNSGNLVVGLSNGQTKLNIQAGGQVTSTGATISGHSEAMVTGTNSRWDCNNLTIGDSFLPATATLTIQNGGLVTVGGTTTINSDDTVTLAGGRFQFGTTSLQSFGRIGGTSGELAGQVSHTAFTNLSTLTQFQSSSLDISEVNVRNSGTLIGTGTLLTGFTNTSTGRIDAAGSSVMRFEGDSNLNQGRINSTGGMVSMAGGLTNAVGGQISNFGGQIVTQGQLINQGFITGRGEFTALGGIVNIGSMAFSGTTDVIGNVTNGGLIVTSANTTTTFFDRVTNNGEIRTSGSGSSVFFDTVSGSGSYTGTGNVFFEGNVNPGNSPALVNFGGNLSLGTGSHTVIELGGLALGEYDRFNISGNFNILGSMSVEMWNGFQPNLGMSFLIADIGGNRSGMFAGLGEGALVGNFGGRDLFITYKAGNGNDIALFSAVPEPNSLLLVMGLLGFASVHRRRRA